MSKNPSTKKSLPTKEIDSKEVITYENGKVKLSGQRKYILPLVYLHIILSTLVLPILIMVGIIKFGPSVFVLLQIKKWLGIQDRALRYHNYFRPNTFNIVFQHPTTVPYFEIIITANFYYEIRQNHKLNKQQTAILTRATLFKTFNL